MSFFASAARILVKYAGNAACFGVGDALVELWRGDCDDRPERHLAR